MELPKSFNIIIKEKDFFIEYCQVQISLIVKYHPLHTHQPEVSSELLIWVSEIKQASKARHQASEPVNK